MHNKALVEHVSELVIANKNNVYACESELLLWILHCRCIQETEKKDMKMVILTVLPNQIRDTVCVHGSTFDDILSNIGVSVPIFIPSCIEIN